MNERRGCMEELIELYRMKLLISKQIYGYMDVEEIGRYEKQIDELIRLYRNRWLEGLDRIIEFEDDN
jgi:hypothetical protein